MLRDGGLLTIEQVSVLGELLPVSLQRYLSDVKVKVVVYVPTFVPESALFRYCPDV